MELQTLTRRFKYGTLDLDDLGPGLSAEHVVRTMWGSTYGELRTAAVEGPVVVGGVEVYTVVRAVRDKG